ASSSECSPHQPVEIVQRPNPTSEAVIPVDPNSRVLMPAVYVGCCGQASGDYGRRPRLPIAAAQTFGRHCRTSAGLPVTRAATAPARGFVQKGPMVWVCWWPDREVRMM